MGSKPVTVSATLVLSQATRWLLTAEEGPGHPPQPCVALARQAGTCSYPSCTHSPSGIRLEVASNKAWDISAGEGARGFPECWCLTLPVAWSAATHH